MKLFVIPNQMNHIQIKATKDCIQSLVKSLDAEISLTKENSLLIFGNEEFSSFSPNDCDYIVSIGGDACVLRAARTAIEYNKPLVGINAGRLGYLCAYHCSELDGLSKESFSKLKKTERLLLKVEHDGNTYTGINDLIIGKSNFGKTIEVDVSCDGKELSSWVGDGIIVASPTGSTAYNQSAGGPELRYDASSFAITPICPHLSKFKPVVVSSDSLILVSSRKTPENIPTIFLDGTKIAELDGSLTVSKSDKKLILCIR